MSNIIRKLKHRWSFLRNYNRELNRRVEIENELIDIANGKRPIPSRDDCQVMALKLGTPKEHWPEKWK